jgi:hypothetical protein
MAAEERDMSLFTAPRNPYVGPRPFQTGEKLFGRDQEVVELANRLAARRVVLLHAPSGAGKTSLVQAGLIPYLQEKGFWTPRPVRMNTSLRNLFAPYLPETGVFEKPNPSLNIGDLASTLQSNRYMFSLFASLFIDLEPVRKASSPLLALPGIYKAIKKLQDLMALRAQSLEADVIRKLEETAQDETSEIIVTPTQNLIDLLEEMEKLEKGAKKTGGASESGAKQTSLADRVVQTGTPVPLGPRTGMLIFFDQFEEILTLDPSDREAKEEFFSWLMPALYDTRAQILFSMREDHIAGLEPYIQYFPDRLSARYRLDFLSREAAIQAVKMPAEKHPNGEVKYAPGVVEQLVSDLQRVRLQEAGQVTESAGLYVEPVQLQVVCSNLWQVKRQDDFLITSREVDALGGVDNALGDYYDHWTVQIAREAKVSEENLRNWLEKSLTTPSGLRNQALAGEEAEYGLTPVVLKELVDAWIIREERRGGRTWYELTHDRMVGPLKSANEAWRKDHVSPFRPQAERWEAGGKPAGLVLLGAALVEAENWAREHPGLTNVLEVEYLEKSRSQQEENERVIRAELGIDLDKRGWGVIYAAEAGEAPPEREALLPLLEHRKEQSRGSYREFIGADGYRVGESARQFLERHGIGFRSLDPAKMPYYLLIVGDPEPIPFEFQYDLSLQFAVGRIEFETLAEYNQYARSVVYSETENEAGRFALPKRMVIFSPVHPDDPATKMGYENLSKPLLETLPKNQADWRIDTFLIEEAMKARLSELLGGGEAPTLFFFTGHALNFPPDSPDLFRQTGALLGQDWGGRNVPVKRDFYFTAEDVGEAGLLGMVAFLFGSSTAGLPQLDNFPRDTSIAARRMAPKPFLSSLPKRLLSDAHGGALAVIGHVERAWGYSFQSKAGSDVEIFEGVLGRLMRGYTAGLAMQAITQRYAILAAILSELLFAEVLTGEAPNIREFQARRTQTIDARNYILIGDPAVRLPLGRWQTDPEKVARPILPPVEIPDEWRQPLLKPETKPVEEEKPADAGASF